MGRDGPSPAAPGGAGAASGGAVARPARRVAAAPGRPAPRAGARRPPPSAATDLSGFTPARLPARFRAVSSAPSPGINRQTREQARRDRRKAPLSAAESGLAARGPFLVSLSCESGKNQMPRRSPDGASSQRRTSIWRAGSAAEKVVACRSIKWRCVLFSRITSNTPTRRRDATPVRGGAARE